MGVRKQHVKTADILHVWIGEPPRAQAYSQTAAANFFFVFWTRCQWLIKHTAYHLTTALNCFYSSFLSTLEHQFFTIPGKGKKEKKKKESLTEHALAFAVSLLSRWKTQLWPGQQDTINTNVSYTWTRAKGKQVRSPFPRLMGWHQEPQEAENLLLFWV